MLRSRVRSAGRMRLLRSSGKLFVESLENKMENLTKTLDDSFKRIYKTKIKELFKTKCKCTKKKLNYQTDHETKCEAKKIIKRH